MTQLNSAQAEIKVRLRADLSRVVATLGGITPLSCAAYDTRIECAQVLLDHNANVNLQDDHGLTPLHDAIMGDGEHKLDTARRLLEHGADPNICDDSHSTPLHQASSRGLLEVARLLLNYRAKINAKDDEGRTPLQVAASERHHEITKLLLEHGAVPPP